MISAEIDLAAEVEREHKKIKEERARKQRGKEVDEHETRKPAKDVEKKATKDLNQNNIGGKPEESKSNGNAVGKKQGIAHLARVQKNVKPSSGTHFFTHSLPHYTALM